MQTITIGTQQLTGKAHYIRQATGRSLLRLEVSQADISHDALKQLLEGHTGAYTVTDEGGTTSDYSGTLYAYSITDKQQVYYVEIEFVSDYEEKTLENESNVCCLYEYVAELLYNQCLNTLGIDESEVN